MNIILFDDPTIRINLLPLTFTRPVGTIRVGIFTIAEKWCNYLGSQPSFSTEKYLSKKFTVKLTQDNYWINGAVCPDSQLINAITSLKIGEGLVKDSRMIALRTPESEIPEMITGAVKEYSENITIIDQVWKIFQLNGAQIREDFKLLTKNRKSAGINDKYTRTYAEENIFIEEGASIKAALLNAENGPIYIGKNTKIHEGAMIRGPFVLCEGSEISMGAKMRGDTTIGPYSKIGGEVSNAVLFGYSNKSHDGFLGNSVIGEWCNLAADTNTSNMKNNYENIKIWNYAKGGFVNTGFMFCGLIMGDHSKCGINLMFNTGTVVGVSANIFGDGYPRTFIPSFAWGGASGFTTYQLNKALETATKVMARRNVVLDESDKEILTHIFDQSSKFRVWEVK